MKNNNDYKEARKKWAREQEELFLNILEKTGRDLGITIAPIQYVRAHKLWVEDLGFGYPAEFELAELISTEETYEQVLAVMTAVMKGFRTAFYKTRKRQAVQKKQRCRRTA